MIGRAFVAVTLLATCAVVPAQAQQQRSKSSDHRAKKICKVEGRVGSRLGANRTCRTQAEWDEIARESRLVTERVQTWTSGCLKGPEGAICGN